MRATLLKASLLAAVLFAAPGQVSAATITTAACLSGSGLGSGTCATSIEDLDIGGTLYDVLFVLNGTYNSIYASEAPLFLGNQAGATTATQAILNTLSAAPLSGVIANPTQRVEFWVPYSVQGASVAVIWAYELNGSWSPVITCGTPCVGAATNYTSELPTHAYSWAVITPSSVPDAGSTLAMFGMALGAFAAVRRRAAQRPQR